MTRPVYKIETYTGAVLDHTIQKDAVNIHVKERVTSKPGLFSFSLPTKKNGDTYYYNDIAVHDKVKIWLGYNTVSGDPDFVGRIVHISGPLSINEGYMRVFTGKSQGEILERRQKTKYWIDTEASTIVTELANDLGLGTGDIASDSTAVTLAAVNEPYWSVLQGISDYWYDGGTQIKKDFYVDIDNDLVWKTRPFRTSGVETLTVGDNIISYVVARDTAAVKNKIHVYGSSDKTYPSDIDGLTDATTDWTPASGTTVETDTDRLHGDYSVKISDDDGVAEATRSNIGTQNGTFPNRETFKYLEFKYKAADDDVIPNPALAVRLLAPDSDNQFVWFFYWATTLKCILNSWQTIQLPLGNKYETGSQWTKVANAAWNNIQSIRISISQVGADGDENVSVKVDALHFSGARYYDVAEDATSQSSYGVHEYTYVDDNLASDSDCEKRAEALLYQMKNVPIRVDIATLGNTNVLVGDRISMTIPAESISSANYDVVEVDHNLGEAGFVTTAKMVNTGDTRVLPPVTQNEVLQEQFNIQKQLVAGRKIIR